MTEYWVSKKQYWCKYCSIWIRDDAPSRRLHETGLKHQGNKERFIRDLYKSGNMAKREKEQEAIEIARIEAAAAAAHSKDTHVAGPSRKAVLYQQSHRASPTPTARPRASGPTDKWANYSTATQLGLADEEEATQETSYEIEQMVRNRPTQVGAWQEVTVEPQGAYSGDGLGKRKLEEGEDEEGEGWKFAHAGKKPVYDPYADEEWDPKMALKGKIRVKEDGGSASPIAGPSATEASSSLEGGLKREEWTGRLDLNPASSANGSGLVYQKGGGWVKPEADGGVGEAVEAENGAVGDSVDQDNGDIKPDVKAEELDTKPNIAVAPPVVPAATEEPTTAAEQTSISLFKKRRPPPSSRKK